MPRSGAALSLEADVGKPLLDVLRDMMLDPVEQAAYTNDPARYVARFGYEDVDTEHLDEAFSLVADTLPPDQARAVASTAGPLGPGAAESTDGGELDDGIDDSGITAVGADTADLNGIDALRPVPDGDDAGDDGGSFGGVDDGFDLDEGFGDVDPDGNGGFGSGDLDLDLDEPVADGVGDAGDIDDGVGSGDLGPDSSVDFGGGSEATTIAEVDDDTADGFDIDDLSDDLGDGVGDAPAFDDTPDYDDGADSVGVGDGDGIGHLLDPVDDVVDDGPGDDPSFDDIGSF